MTKKINLVLIFFFFSAFCLSGHLSKASMTGYVDTQAKAEAQEKAADFEGNSCVECHSNLTEPVYQVNRYYEWHFSKHRENGVSCNKCHGGQADVKEKEGAHQGVLNPSDKQSRLFTWNQPETCRECHQPIANSFSRSNHYVKLKSAGLGPACNTCHIHMASQVLHSPEEVASLCANCHNTINGLLPQRPDIPESARDNVMSFQRADFVIEWTALLLAEGQRRGFDVSAEDNELQDAKSSLMDAKVQWHTFYLENVKNKSDAAFLKVVKVRDSLRRKLSR